MERNSFYQTALFRLGIFCLIFVFAVIPLHTQAASDKNSDEIIFGVLPIVSTKKLIARFAPLADYLSEKTGKSIRLETATDFKTFMYRTNNEKRYDLLFTAPHLYYLAQRKAGYKVITRVAAPNMRALIVVPKKSGIIKLRDLRGHTLATTDPLALATLMIKAHLFQAGINPDKDLTLIHTPTHNASLLSAYKGVTDAASLMHPPYKRAKKDIKQTMRILSMTDGSPHMPIAVSSGMNKELIKKIKIALVQLKTSEKGRSLLKQMKWPGFVSANPRDYDTLKWAVEQLK